MADLTERLRLLEIYLDNAESELSSALKDEESSRIAVGYHKAKAVRYAKLFKENMARVKSAKKIRNGWRTKVLSLKRQLDKKSHD